MAIPPGTPGNDTIPGTEENDLIEGLGGDDSLTGAGGNDTLRGGSGADKLEGGSGIDRLSGGSGNDLLILGSFDGGSAGRADGGIGDDTLRIYEGHTTLAGGEGSDMLSIYWTHDALVGDTVIDLSSGAGQITSANGSHASVSGFEQLDVLLGAGNHSVIGTALDDRIWFLGLGNQMADAGDGNDSVYYRIRQAVTLEGGIGEDTLAVESVSDATTYFIVDGLTGEVDDGQLSQITGFEAFDLTTGTGNAIVSLGAGNDTVHALRGDDTLLGQGGRDTLFAGGGNDEVFGGHDGDRLSGGAGSDTVDGGGGRDVLIASRGNDVLTGGQEADRFVFAGPDNGFDLITDFDTGLDQIRYLGASLGPLVPAAGAVGADLLHSGGPVGTAAQFITLYDAQTDQTTLLYYDKGTETNGAFALLRLQGDVSLSAGDLWLI